MVNGAIVESADNLALVFCLRQRLPSRCHSRQHRVFALSLSKVSPATERSANRSLGVERLDPEDFAGSVAGIGAGQRGVPGKPTRAAHVDEIAACRHDLTGTELLQPRFDILV